MEALIQTSEKAAKGFGGERHLETPGVRLLIIKRTQAPMALLEELAVSPGRVDIVTGVEQAVRALKVRSYLAILLDLNEPDDKLLGMIEQVGEYKGQPFPLLIGFSDHISISLRVSLLRLGFNRILNSSISAPDFYASLGEAARCQSPNSYTAIVLHGDEALRRKLSEVLEGEGIVPHLVDKDSALAADWPACWPDFLLLEWSQASHEMQVLSRFLKSHPGVEGPAVIFLTEDDAPGTRKAILRSGADDYVLLPLVEAELSNRLRNRLTLQRLKRSSALNSAARTCAPFPAEEASQLQSMKKDTPGPLTKDHPVSILISIDDPFTREILKHRLDKMDWRVVLAEDGEAAEKWLMQEPFNVVVLDVYMPFRSGFDVLNWVKKESAMKDVKVILATAYHKESAEIQAFAQGADDFIAKPLNPEVLVSRIQRLLQIA